MRHELEESIRKNLIIYLSHHCCKYCYKPYSNSTYVEPDDLSFIFADKLFYKLNCTISNNTHVLKKNIRYIDSKTRVTFSPLTPSTIGDVERFVITCIYCYNSNFIEYNMEKIIGTKNYLNQK